jgi:hypothetical protein
MTYRGVPGSYSLSKSVKLVVRLRLDDLEGGMSRPIPPYTDVPPGVSIESSEERDVKDAGVPVMIGERKLPAKVLGAWALGGRIPLDTDDEPDREADEIVGEPRVSVGA